MKEYLEISFHEDDMKSIDDETHLRVTMFVGGFLFFTSTVTETSKFYEVFHVNEEPFKASPLQNIIRNLFINMPRGKLFKLIKAELDGEKHVQQTFKQMSMTLPF